MDEKPQDEHQPVLKDRKEQRVQNPALWLGLLAVPIVLAFIIGIVKPDRTFTPPERPVNRQPSDGQRALAPISADTPIIAQAIQSTRPDDEPVSETGCDFSDWVGLEVSEEMQKAIKDAKRPFRILPPGSMMTMDHNPERVNFDLDNAGTITRVWCG